MEPVVKVFLHRFSSSVFFTTCKAAHDFYVDCGLPVLFLCFPFVLRRLQLLCVHSNNLEGIVLVYIVCVSVLKSCMKSRLSWTAFVGGFKVWGLRPSKAHSTQRILFSPPKWAVKRETHPPMSVVVFVYVYICVVLGSLPTRLPRTSAISRQPFELHRHFLLLVSLSKFKF